jgi:hypothetical protein
MKTIQYLIELIQAGKKPIVTFKQDISDKESYPEAGTRARATAASQPDSDGVIEITFDYSEFDEINIPLELTNYYDKSGAPSLTARQAGYYKPIDIIYFDASEKLEQLMDIESDVDVSIFEAFKQEATEFSYVQWLESKFLAQQSTTSAEVVQFKGEVAAIGDNHEGQPRIVIYGSREDIQPAAALLLKGSMTFSGWKPCYTKSDH